MYVALLIHIYIATAYTQIPSTLQQLWTFLNRKRSGKISILDNSNPGSRSMSALASFNECSKSSGFAVELYTV
ncbi:hypothetical protein L211DRAFT_835316 [Terfezia boudieri ATCC MYA-4762]|uniref:Uncharacterized protein n=1 Tax=Terfezia boudieri ATCC MYA-4762 TaxID=1051890 RepID=A0A3N4M9N1_9PEZI|nr:hypothetical protein L211DRAFT_835316 [Terfezia boudieri ATCC MYA-4762]